MRNTLYKIYDLTALCQQHARNLEKEIVYFRAYGWHNSTDVDKINESMDVYRTVLPTDIFSELHESEYAIMEVDNLIETMDFLGENLPESQANCTKEYYIHYTIFNSIGQIIASNE